MRRALSVLWRCLDDRAVALCVVLALLFLAPLAGASPPDPLWIAGIYDERDLDDVVIAVASASAELAQVACAPEKPILGPQEILPAEEASITAGAPWSLSSVRAPPA